MKKILVAELDNTNEKLENILKGNLEIKRVLLLLFAKAYDYEMDELDDLLELKVNRVYERYKTEQERKEHNERENTIINYVLKIKKDLE